MLLGGAVMPTCGNCGSHVTDDYVRVRYWPEVDTDNLPCCPHCEDKVFREGEIRDARSNAGRGH